MTAPATPRTDAEQDNSETIDEAFNFARTLERELAARTAERDDYGNRLDRLADSHALTLKCYEEAEAENAALLALLERCRPAVLVAIANAQRLGWWTTDTTYQTILTEIDATLKGKGT